jgi:DNA modification methylase
VLVTTCTVLPGDCLERLRELPDNSVDAVITDPPYGLSDLKPAAVTAAIVAWANGNREQVPDSKGFMGRAWDGFVPPPAVWDECLRVLKPGGHMLVFAGSRTVDLMGLSIRLAGFELRDSISWLYGSGFPKSLDVSKAIDKARDDNPDRRAVGAWLRVQREAAGLRQKDVAQHWPSATGGLTGCVTNWEHGFNLPTWDQWLKLRELIGFGDEMDAEVWRLNGRKGTPGEAWDQREVIDERVEHRHGGSWTDNCAGGRFSLGEHVIQTTAPATDAARQWQGWGTALKPAAEPILVARKPLSGTVAATVLEHGTGALNIDGCRVGTGEPRPKMVRTETIVAASSMSGASTGATSSGEMTTAGRWPTNVVLDEHAAAELDEQSGITTSSSSPRRNTAAAHNKTASMGKSSGDWTTTGHSDSGGASRFFPVFRYQAKASAKERPKVDGVAHPTCKPLALMRWLVRLVTPPGGTVLEPFAGSGTTIEAAIYEGFNVIGIEREPIYLPLIQHRIRRAAEALQPTPEETGPTQGDLFDPAA